MRSLITHLHLAQPPREDPWFGGIDADPEAAPDHDWHARLERVCYRMLGAARVLDEEGRIARVVDTLALSSFDVAPTLLAWMARHARATYAAILAADRASVRRLGYGNAIAHPYDHAILPLLSRRDKATEVCWGIAAFRAHFGREPDGMWLPELAVDDETLDVLAEQGVRFTVLAPHQVAGMPGDGRPGRYRTAAGREIAVFVYDGPLAHDVAFGGVLRDGRGWARRIAGESGVDPLAHRRDPVRLAEDEPLADGAPELAAELAADRWHDLMRAEPRVDVDGPATLQALPPAAPPRTTVREPEAAHDAHDARDARDARARAAARRRGVVARDDEGTVVVATAAEVYGFHHAFGEMALAAMYDELASRAHVQVENFARALARHAARATPLDAAGGAGAAAADVTLAAPSSWSCPHGVDRWRQACGCRRDPTSHQGWRAPLRAAVEELRLVMHARFVREGAQLFGGEAAAWAARDAYGGDGGGAVPATADPVWARELLEMMRELLALSDSHAWGADELGAREIRQLLRHAARAVALAGPERGALERRFIERLAAIRDGDPSVGSARDLYLRHARHPLPAAVRVGAAWAVLRAVGAPSELAAPETWAVEERRRVPAPPDERAPGRDGAPPAPRDASRPDGAPAPAVPPDEDDLADGGGTAAGVGAVAAARVQPVAGGAGRPGGDGLDAGLDAVDFVLGGPVELAVIERRLGAMARYHVTVDVPGPADPLDERREAEPAAGGARRHRLADVDPRAITVFVQPVAGAGSPPGSPGGLATALKLDDLPERARQAVLFALRRAVINRLLDAAERERLASGEATLRELVEHALVAAVQRLAEDGGAGAVARVLGLADLAESVAGEIPADAQTMLARVRGTVDVAARERLASVAWRLGFSSRAWSGEAPRPAGGARRRG